MVRRGSRAATSTVVVHLGPIDPAADPSRVMSPPPPLPARAGFVVGRSVARSAVVRNRVMRRLRHIMASQLNELPDGTGVVVRALPRAADASWEELTADVASALGRCRRSMGRVPAPAAAVSS